MNIVKKRKEKSRYEKSTGLSYYNIPYSQKHFVLYLSTITTFQGRGRQNLKFKLFCLNQLQTIFYFVFEKHFFETVITHKTQRETHHNFTEFINNIY